MRVTLQPLDEALIDDLLAVAMAAATPEETMPPVDGPPGWTHARRAAFTDFYRARLDGLAGSRATAMFAILVEGEVAGMIRLARTAIPGQVETGMWLGRGHRGRGLAGAALRAMLAEARSLGADTVVADTTPGNAAALGTLRSCGAVLTPDEAAGKVFAHFDVGAGG